MASVHDVAAYIVKRMAPSRRKPLTAMKLQKLVYYSQAWHLVWEDRPLFRARIEAWANGPVSPTLYKQHRRQFYVGSWCGNPNKLDDEESTTVDAVIEFYGPKTSQWLSDLTHKERPWCDARRRAGVGPGERCTATISHAAMAKYYGSLVE